MVAYDTKYYEKHALGSLALAGGIERPTCDMQGGWRAVVIRKKREEIYGT